MPDIKCPHCGSLVPQGSKFCNNCGAPLDQEIQCPHCNSVIPANSVFCPVCHNIVGKAADAGGDQQQSAPAQAGQGQHTTRNTIIILAVLAFVGLIVVKQCFFSGSRDVTPDEVSITGDNANNNTIDIFNRTLEANNLKGDGDKIAYAMRVMDKNGKEDKIIGVTYLNDDQHPFFKIYTLTQNGANWDIKLNKTKYLNGNNLIFDPAELRAGDAIPYSDNINGKNYFYFAYLTVPQKQQGTVGTLTAVLFDIEAGDIVSQIDFNGNIATSSSSGQQELQVTGTSTVNGILATRLKEWASNIGYLHIPTPEEIAAQKAEQEKAAAEKAHADSVARGLINPGAGGESLVDPNDLETGEEVKMNVQQYDKSKPLFHADEFSKKVKAPGYTVFLLKNGRVYALSKRSNTNFEVHYGGSGATDIGWEDSERGIINIRTPQGKYQYNLSTNTAKKIE